MGRFSHSPTIIALTYVKWAGLWGLPHLHNSMDGTDASDRYSAIRSATHPAIDTAPYFAAQIGFDFFHYTL